MGRGSSATLNQQLTSYAQGHMNDLADTMVLAERLIPTVPVPAGSGQFKVFDDLNSFQLYATERAMGGDAKRIEFAATDAYYNTEPNALEVTVDQEERDKAGEDPLAQQLLDEGKVRALLNATSLAHVKKCVDFVLANVAAQANRGVFSDPDIDPIDQLDEQLDGLSKDVGSASNIKMTMSVGAWRILRNHPKVKARVNHNQPTPLTRQQLVDSFVIPVDLGIFSITYNTAGLGAAKAKARIVDSDILLHYSIPNATQYDPSPFKCFTRSRTMVTAVRTYRDPSDRYDVHAVDWSEDLKQTSTIAMRRITVS